MTAQQTLIGLRRVPDVGLGLQAVRLAKRVARGLVTTWLIFNVVTWAPTVDAMGNCDCPLCNPFGRMSAAHTAK